MYFDRYRDAFEYVRGYYEKTAPQDRYAFHPWSSPEFKLAHVLRELRYSMMLASTREANLDTVSLAAILHDLAAYAAERRDHAIAGSKVAEDYLRKEDYPDALTRDVVRAIAVHAGPLIFEARTIEEKILQDADTIDKVSAFGITALLLNCGSMKCPPNQALEELKKEMLPKLKWYVETMHTPEGKRIVSKGCRYSKRFISLLEEQL